MFDEVTPVTWPNSSNSKDKSCITEPLVLSITKLATDDVSAWDNVILELKFPPPDKPEPAVTVLPVFTKYVAWLPSSKSAFKLDTKVVLAITRGAVPLSTLDVNTPPLKACKLVVPVTVNPPLIVPP